MDTLGLPANLLAELILLRDKLARWTGETTIDTVLAAAAAWKARCFENNLSVFSDRSLWTSENLEDLYRRFAGNPIVGTQQDFYEKLGVQISDASADVKRLAAEAVWLTLLFPSNMGAEKKRQRILPIWATSGDELPPISENLGDDALAGVGNPGIYYMTGLFNEFGFALDVCRRWKQRPVTEQVIGTSEADAWSFAGWLDEVPGASSRPMRNALLYFLFPDQFERNLSTAHRWEIYNALQYSLAPAERVEAGAPLIKLDRAIYSIRNAYEARLGTDQIDFYRPPLDRMWVIQDRDKRRKQLATELESILSNYNLELNQPGIKKKTLADTRPVSELTGYWQNPNDATNKPLRWLLHLDLTNGALVAKIPAQHGSRRLAFVNTAQGKSGAVLVRIVPALKVAENKFEFFETWEWLLLFCFLPNLPVGSAAQLFEDFDPDSGVLTYMAKEQPYIATALIGLNDGDSTFTTEVAGKPKTITYADATLALRQLLHVAPVPALTEAT